MNPSNFGITAAAAAASARWVSIAPPYEFTERANTYFRIMIPMVILTAGTVINAMLTSRVAADRRLDGRLRHPGVRPALDLGRPADHRARRR